MIAETIHTLLNTVTVDNFPMRAPQGHHVPFILFAQITTDPTIVKDTVSRLDVLTYQISCFHTTLLAAKTMAAAVRTAVDGYKSSTVDHITFRSEVDIYEEDTQIYHIAQEYSIRLKR